MATAPPRVSVSRVTRISRLSDRRIKMVCGAVSYQLSALRCQLSVRQRWSILHCRYDASRTPGARDEQRRRDDRHAPHHHERGKADALEQKAAERGPPE